MNAAVTERVGSMVIDDRPEPRSRVPGRSHRVPLAKAPEALRFAISNSTEVMKVVIRGE